MSDDSGHRSEPRPAGRGRALWTLLAGVAVVVFTLDQLSKHWAVNALDDRIIELVGSLQLRLTFNHGAAFSISQGRGALISLLAIAVVGVLVFSGRQATRPLPAVALGMVLGGAIGNLADRAFRDGDGFLGGGVVDFIDLQWWPIFNLADSAVVCGALLLVASSWREEAARPDDEPDAGADGAAAPEADGRSARAGAADDTNGADGDDDGDESRGRPPAPDLEIDSSGGRDPASGTAGPAEDTRATPVGAPNGNGRPVAGVGADADAGSEGDRDPGGDAARETRSAGSASSDHR